MKRYVRATSGRGIIGNFALGLESRDELGRILSKTGMFSRGGGVLPQPIADRPDSRIVPVITTAAIRGPHLNGGGLRVLGVTERNQRGDPYGASCLFFPDSATKASSSATM